MLADAQAIRQGASLAALARLLPHRGETVHEVRTPDALLPVLRHLQDSYFSGITEVRRSALPGGLLVHSAGRLTHAFLDSVRDRSAIHALRGDHSVSQLLVRRTAQAVMVASGALFEGTVTGQWILPSSQDIEAAALNLTGALVWMGVQPHVCVYRNGNLCPDSAEPNVALPGPLLQFSVPVQPSAQDLLEEVHTLTPTQSSSESGLVVGAAVPTALGATSDALSAELIWQVSLGIYEKRLGRAAKPALDKLQRDMAGLPPHDLLVQVKKRLEVTLGAAAVAALEEGLGGST